MIGGLLLAIGIALALGLRSSASVLWPWLDIALITGLIIAGMRFLKRISNSNSNGNTHYIDSNSGNTYYSDSGWHDGSRHSHRANRGEEARQEDRHDDGWGGEGGGDGGGGGD